MSRSWSKIDGRANETFLGTGLDHIVRTGNVRQRRRAIANNRPKAVTEYRVKK